MRTYQWQRELYKHEGMREFTSPTIKQYAIICQCLQGTSSSTSGDTESGAGTVSSGVSSAEDDVVGSPNEFYSVLRALFLYVQLLPSTSVWPEGKEGIDN